jgi:hypothetical protein
MNIKKVTLYKRGSKYYAKTCFLGTVYTVSTGTSDKNDAWEIAPGRLTKKVQEQRTKGSSVRSAIEHYLDFNTESRDKTKRGVISFVKSYCKLLGYNLDTPAKQAFTKQSAIRFQQLRLADVEPEDRPRVARSTNTILRSVKCLYSERLLDTYDKIPDHVTSFKRVRSLKAPSVQYTVADKKEKIAEAIRRCDALEDENYGAWLTYYLSLNGAGLLNLGYWFSRMVTFRPKVASRAWFRFRNLKSGDCVNTSSTVNTLFLAPTRRVTGHFLMRLPRLSETAESLAANRFTSLGSTTAQTSQHSWESSTLKSIWDITHQRSRANTTLMLSSTNPWR